MAEIVNLRRARKAKARAVAADEAAVNRVRFGRSKAERAASTAQKDLAARKLDAHFVGAAKEEPPPDPGSGGDDAH